MAMDKSPGGCDRSDPGFKKDKCGYQQPFSKALERVCDERRNQNENPTGLKVLASGAEISGGELSHNQGNETWGLMVW